MAEDLTPEQLAECKETFNYFDKDSDGSVTSKLLGTIMRCLGQNPTEAELLDMTNEINLSGTIDIADFLKLMAMRYKDKDAEDEFKEAFRMFDKENTGQMSAMELRHVLTEMGEEKITNEEMEELIKETGIDRDGQIKYEEFIKLLMAKQV